MDDASARHEREQQVTGAGLAWVAPRISCVLWVTGALIRFVPDRSLAREQMADGR